jgi:WD40 repeat protein
MNNSYTSQYVIYVWDRWGNETLLEGHTEYICCLKYSLDGEYLASGSEDESIRIWSRESCHATTSNPDSERPTRIPQQADKIILGSYPIMALSFSRTDSNLLASGGLHGDIKLWNATEQACIHSFESHGGPIRSLFFTGGADIACIAAAEDGSIIRLWKAEGTSDLASETFREADRGGNEICRAVFSPSGSFLAINFGSRTGNGSTVALYELETMTKTQSVIMPWFIPSHIAVTSDSKQLVVVGRRERIRLLQTDDLSIQRDFDPRKGMPNMPSALSVAFDPTCRVLAVGYRDGGLELRSL